MVEVVNEGKLGSFGAVEYQSPLDHMVLIAIGAGVMALWAVGEFVILPKAKKNKYLKKWFK